MLPTDVYDHEVCLVQLLQEWVGASNCPLASRLVYPAVLYLSRMDIWWYMHIHTHKYTDIHCIALHRIALHCIALHYITHTFIYIYIYVYIHICVCVLRKHARNRHLNLWRCKDGIGSYRVHVTFLEAQVDGEWLAGIAFAAENHTDTADMRRQCDLQV